MKETKSKEELEKTKSTKSLKNWGELTIASYHLLTVCLVPLFVNRTRSLEEHVALGQTYRSLGHSMGGP